MSDPKTQLLEAAIDHVVFDGWSKTTFKAAIEDSGVDPAIARGVCPRGAVDLAVAFHKAGDEAMIAAIEGLDMSELRYSEKVARLVRLRFEVIPDKEAVRRAATLFSLPQYGAEGSKLIWGTADEIWNALGDTSDDLNWYSKRAILSGVYYSTLLYWLGDDSLDGQATWDFLDRRIDDVMLIEKVKGKVNSNPLLKPLMAGPNMLASMIKAPKSADLPGG
ncbi:MAG: COQ9 family protein [Rhodobacteraceae bacterium]|nr:COQ9 family protein [Paracoccaceae bacterium]